MNLARYVVATAGLVLVWGCSAVTPSDSPESADQATSSSPDVAELLRRRLVQVPGGRPDGVIGVSALSVNGVPVLDFHLDGGTVAFCFEKRDTCAAVIAGEVIAERSVDIDSSQTNQAMATIIAVPTEVPTADRTIDVDYWTNVELVSTPPTWLSEVSNSAD